MKLLRTIFTLMILAGSTFGSSKSPGLYIGFHAEGDEVEGPKFVRPDVVGGEKHYFRVSPELVARHFDGFYPFSASDGTSGVALRLNTEGQRAYQVMCSTNQGRLLRAIVGNQAVDVVKVDGNATADGYIVIWRGLTDEHFLLMEKKMKRLDGLKTQPPEKKKKEKPTKREASQ